MNRNIRITNKIIHFRKYIYEKNENEEDDDVCDYENEWKIGKTQHTFWIFSHHYLLSHFLWLFKR